MDSFSGIKAEATRLLTGVEEGTLSAADAAVIAGKCDPVIIHFVMRYLREKYPASSPTSQGVIDRLVELTKTYDTIVLDSKKGEDDPVTGWFNDTYDLHEWFDKPQELIDMLVEKIEG